MKKILIVDDNPVSRELIRELLDSPNLQVLEAVHGQHALEIIAAALPDVVLMDIQMPVLDGFAALRLLRRDPRFEHVCVVALTAFAMHGDEEKALAAGFDGYITKPIDAVALERQIRDLLDRRPYGKCTDAVRRDAGGDR